MSIMVNSRCRRTSWSSVASEGGCQVYTILVVAVEVLGSHLEARIGGNIDWHSGIHRMGEIRQGRSQNGAVRDVVMHFV